MNREYEYSNLGIVISMKKKKKKESWREWVKLYNYRNYNWIFFFWNTFLIEQNVCIMFQDRKEIEPDWDWIKICCIMIDAKTCKDSLKILERRRTHRNC